MGLLYSYGTALVDREELLARRVSDENLKLDSRGFAVKSGSKVSFSTGEFAVPTFAEVNREFLNDAGVSIKDVSGNPIGFEPIGPNKPLTISIREVYTGRYPKYPAFDRSLLVASAVKGTSIYSEAPRAVNLLKPDAARNTPFRVFEATRAGTPYVYHTPALTSLSTSVTVELNFAGFPTELINGIGDILQGASAIPVFATAGPYLLIAGVITKLAGNIGHAIADSGPAELTYNEEVNFVDPGSLLPLARFVLAIDSREPDRDIIARDYKIDDQGKLVKVSDSQSAYKGDAPYVILSLNGAERKDLKDFAPTAMTAAQLNRFYNLGEGRQTAATISIDSFKAYSDLTLTRRIRDLQEKLAQATDDAAKKKIQEEIDGLGKSLFSTDLQKLLRVSQ